MEKDRISIGKMAEMSQLTVATLRLYDEMGLLKPKYKDPATGYRYYDIAQNARLDMIRYMKDLGMSLNEIRDVLQKEDILLIETILVQKNEQLHSQMRTLRAQHDAVELPAADTQNGGQIVRRDVLLVFAAEKGIDHRVGLDNHLIRVIGLDRGLLDLGDAHELGEDQGEIGLHILQKAHLALGQLLLHGGGQRV